MSFKLGPKILIVNVAAQAQLLFFSKLASGIKNLVETDDDYQTSTAFDDLVASPDTISGDEGDGFLPATPATDETIAQADFLRIVGFVDLEGADIVSVIGAKGVTGAYQVAEITFSAFTPVAGEEVTVHLDFQSANNEGEFATNQSDYKRRKSFTIVVEAGDSVTDLATKLKNDINGIIDSGWATWITATSAAGVVTLTSTNVGVTFTASFVTDAALTTAFAITTDGYEGRNTYAQLKALRLETVNGAYAESSKTNQVPLAGSKYSSYLITKTVSRPDLSGFGSLNDTPSGTFQYLIYVNESLTAYISALTKWLNANVAVRSMYTDTAAQNVIDTDTVASASSVDSSEPFTTPLV